MSDMIDDVEGEKSYNGLLIKVYAMVTVAWVVMFRQERDNSGIVGLSSRSKHQPVWYLTWLPPRKGNSRAFPVGRT